MVPFGEKVPNKFSKTNIKNGLDINKHIKKNKHYSSFELIVKHVCGFGSELFVLVQQSMSQMWEYGG
jgi:hypothetical protein